MNNFLTPAGQARRLRGGLLALALGALGSGAAQAQILNYTPVNAQNVTGAYVDLGVNGIPIATASTDDANSAALPLGFTLNFNGTAFTQFVLNTNGLIRLGAAPPSATNVFLSQDQTASNTAVDPLNSTDPADVNLVMPFNIDLVAGNGAGGASYKYLTLGPTGAHITTVQWTNVSDKAGTGTDVSATQYANFSFQVRFFEATGNIEFVYGPAVAGAGAPIARFPNVGIKGSSATQTVLANKTLSSDPWSTTVFIRGPYGTSTHNFRATVAPDLGRTYRFVPTAATSVDAALAVVYTLGEISRTVASPHVVKAVVTNVGGAALTNVPVTLAVTGVTSFTNTQTIAALASGASATVTFAAYPVTTLGTNTVTVTVAAPGDLVAANNSASSSQLVADRLAYTDPAVTTFAGSLGSVAANSYLFVKYTTTGPANVTAITPTFGGAGMAGDTYQVLVYDATGTGGTPGAAPLYTSPARPRPVAAGPDVVTITPTAVNGAFFVATKQLAANNIGLSYQSESPLRPGIFYFSANGTSFTDLSTSTFPARLAIEATVISTVSATRAVLAGGELAVFPNPAHGAFTVAVPALASPQPGVLEVINALGQVVRTQALAPASRATQVSVDAATLAPGIYTVRVRAGAEAAAVRLTVQ